MILKITRRRLTVAFLALVGIGLLFAWSGLFPIAASSGHWPITDWFLHWTMQNSARTYSALESPDNPRDDNGLVSAAGHFHQSCAVCHGAPGKKPSPSMQAATPHAPDLSRTVSSYSDRELFWIVNHGVKYTGMPAWPTQERPDEVRRMVGFLRRLPNMEPAEYRRLVEAPAGLISQMATGDPVSSCAGCHGHDGLGRGQDDIPILAGQKAVYLYASLRRYASGKRKSGPMNVAAAALDDAEMRMLAEFYARQPGLLDTPLPKANAIITSGMPDRQLPACTSCHAPRKPAPLIAGQRETYIASRIHTWRGHETVTDVKKPQAPMPVIARRIPADAVGAIAHALSNAD